MAAFGKREQELFDQALRAREREVKTLEERMRTQEEALQNLNANLEQADRSIAALTSLQHLFLAGDGPREVAQSLLELACKASRCEGGVLSLRESSQAHMTIVGAVGDRAAALRGQLFQDRDGILGEVMRTGDPLLVPDARREPRLRREGPDFVQREARNSLCVPVPGATRAWGAMLLVNTVGRKRFTRQDIDLQTIFAMRLARELDRETEYHRAREEATRLSTLLRVTELLHVASDPHKLSDLVVQLTGRLVKGQGAAVLLADETGQALTLESATERPAVPVHVPIGSGVAGWVALEGQPVNARVGSDPRFGGHLEPIFPFRVDTVAAVPIRWSNRVGGVLLAVNSLHAGAFDQSDLALLTLLARETGIAMDRLQQARQDQRMIMELLRGLARFIDAKAPHLAGHSERVGKIAQTLGEEMGLGPAEAHQAFLAGLLHDLGNVGVDDELFLAARPLTAEETSRMAQHTSVGAEILKDVTALRPLAVGALAHHERYDGSGYPQRLKGDTIPQLGRLLAVAEAFDAVRSARPYRKAMELPEALAHVRQGSGTLFDPKVVEALVSAYQRGRLPA